MATPIAYPPLLAPAHSQSPQRVNFASRNAGLLFVICAQFFLASMNLSVKLLENLHPPTPTLELITIRMLITACCCLTYLVAKDIPDPFLGPKDVRGLLVTRGFGGFFGIFGIYYALNYLSLADATVITFLSPFSVALAAHLLLGESYTKKDALAGVCSLLGVLLIARPTFLFGTPADHSDDADITPFERLRAIGSSLIGVGGITAAFITMRAIGKRAHPVHLMSFFSFCSVVMASIALAIVRESIVFPMTWKWITLLLSIVLFGLLGQILVTMGLRNETATRASLGSYCQLLFAVVLERVVFGTVPSLSSVAGAAVIVAAQTYAILSKQKSPDESLACLSPSDEGEESGEEGVSQITARSSGETDPEAGDQV